ncbi:hypothetical protein FZEAL_1531 [Fusarium zealandicum]|uniref:BTB domain-containing protein n=1 Tax=Fusarium zealandicum TaxID=1053134 RepID=A0A8H4USJ6_9HYPO|nr:hypothetical protein FZEAL_1531 [Fusarium zealandicum]
MVSRISSDGPPPGTGRKWGSLLGKIGRERSRPKTHQHTSEINTSDLDLKPRSPDSTFGNPLENQESNIRQLQSIIQRMPRNLSSGPSHVDAAYTEFKEIREQCATLCRYILTDELRRARDARVGAEALIRRDSSVESPRSPGQVYDTRSSFSGRSLAEVVSGSVSKSIHQNDAWLSAVRDWKNYLESLAEACRTSLADTYKNNEREATPEMVEAMFTNKRFRKEAVARMRNASVTRVIQLTMQFPKYEMRFYNYDKIKQELLEIRQLLQSGESGISPERTLKEFAISPRGDAILEFSNNGPECGPNPEALRFRVSSYMLAETSPIFARMFSGHSSSLHQYDDEDISAQLPAPPSKYICKDGSEAKLYRMPQVELNRLDSMEILLHAAHMHNEMVPREITFEQFVAIAECCMKYKSTSPLELVVEHRWMPQWMHKGADDMPEGLLVISYAFGLRQLFSRMSKTTILNLVDEKELQAKPWPQKIKDKIWAVRCAKVAQLHDCCVNAIQEYLRMPTHASIDESSESLPSEPRASFSSGSLPVTMLTSTPRCPKGSHWCDATNLGWLMLVYNEMDLLPHIMRPGVLSHLPESQPQPRSLTQTVDALRGIPAPPTPVHLGVCDPGPAFRSAINDIYNSVLGLTLFDISGKSHGWGLSKHKEREPQTQLNKGLNRMAASDPGYSVATEFPEIIRLRVMCELDELDDLHATARISRAYYETYKRHELHLMRNILRMDRRRAPPGQHIPISARVNEEKILKEEATALRAAPADMADGFTIRSEEDDDDVDYTDSDDESLYSSLAPSTQRSAARSSFSRPDRQRSADPVAIRTDSPAQTPRPWAGTSGSTGVGSPTTPRQVPANPPSASSPPQLTIDMFDDTEQPPLTVEEAHRILWPDEAVAASAPTMPHPAPGVEGIREKFRVGDPAFAQGLEEKTLVPTGDKQLRSEHDRRVGLLKGEPTNGSGSRASGSK